ncbi:MAG: ferredoxin--NADP reductase [Rhodospirillales bacterium]|jgi:3-ketosteroid 9alpha-monooxygenase subunit B|nr:ferredoxin--NADP reductase [Rhodospirillales bacterium]
MKFYPLTVLDVIDETDSARSFVLEPQADSAEHFHYKAGQFLTFRVPWNDAEDGFLDRCYSLSSAPETSEHMKVTVKREQGGRVSNWFNDTVKAGDVIDVAAPSGRFVLKGNDKPLALFAAGSGITPVLSIIKSTLAGGAKSIRLFYANRDKENVIFHQELDALCNQHSDILRCHHHLDSDSGFVNPDIIKPQCGDAEHYVCGPGPFMDIVEDALADFGVKDSEIHIERFTTLEDASSSDVKTKAPSDVTGFRATLDFDDHDVVYEPDQTLLESMLSAGLDPAHSCKNGKCGSCMVLMKDGEVEMHSNKVLSKRDLEKGYVLLCQSVPMSKNVWVDCDE